eukprot:Lankesteria_metandrocarpae@DN800_c0_g1_i1.p1
MPTIREVFSQLLFCNLTPHIDATSDDKSSLNFTDIPLLYSHDDPTKWSQRFLNVYSQKANNRRECCSHQPLKNNQCKPQSSRCGEAAATMRSVTVRSLLSVFKLQLLLLALLHILMGLTDNFLYRLFRQTIRLSQKCYDAKDTANTVTLSKQALNAAVVFATVKLFAVIAGGHLKLYKVRVSVRLRSCLQTLVLPCLLSDERKLKSDDSRPISFLNVSSTDAASISHFMLACVEALVLPFVTTTTYINVAIDLGYASMFSFGVLAFFFTILMTISVRASYLKVPYQQSRDLRIRRTQEAFRVLDPARVMSWQRILFDRIDTCRAAENILRRRRESLLAVSHAIRTSSASIIALPMFVAAAFISRGSGMAHHVSVETLMPITLLLGRLAAPITKFPTLVANYIEGVISIQRYDQFCLQQKFCHNTAKMDAKPMYDIGGDSITHVMFQDVSFTWNDRPTCDEPSYMACNENNNAPHLSNIPHTASPLPAKAAFCLQASRLVLCADEVAIVTGDHQCGKSSLLHAILGDMTVCSTSSSSSSSYPLAHINSWVRSIEC